MNPSRVLAGGSFQKKLAFGMLAETDIARWLIAKGYSIIPAYDIEYECGKGPRMFTGDSQIAVPDLITIDKNFNVRWIEAKHKTRFSWHRKTKRFVTGIDVHHYQQYLDVGGVTNWPIWVLFLHQSSNPSQEDLLNGCPKQCPTGLYGRTLRFLFKNENHRHPNHGKLGMVYWDERKLTKLASLDEINLVAKSGSET